MIDKRQQIDRETLSKRNSLKNVYRTEAGIYELARSLRELGVFDEIPNDPEKVALRNYGIRKMEDLGMLDEESIIALVKWMLNGEWKTPIELETDQGE